MFREQAAALLDGSEYGEEGSPELFAQMAAARLVAIFGASDDLTELRGAVNDETGDSAFLLSRGGLVVNPCDEGDRCPNWSRVLQALDTAGVTPIWDEGEVDGVRYSWRYQTDIPHSTFKVLEDGEPYCLGIVISLDDLS